jgi:uncharacterized protein (TIGR03435 family)
MRRTDRIAWLPLLIAACSFGQPVRARPEPGITEMTQSQAAARAADATAEFEVATVKPSDPDKCCARYFSRNGRRFATTNTNLKYLIQWAWNLQAKQVAGPEWMDQARFDVVGEMSGAGTPTDHEWKAALQKLLIDRFQLKLHHESREMAAYALTVAKGGAKLTPTAAPAGEQHMGFSGAVGETMRGIGVRASIPDFVGELQRIVLDRPIVDRTGLTGEYDIEFSFTREDNDALGMTQLPDNAAPNLITALNQQLGLKLEGVKAPVDVLMIDQAQQPSAN